jgi:hypothetical protein
MQKSPHYSKIYTNRTILPIYYANISDDEMCGGEAIAKLTPANNLRIEFSYSLLKIIKRGRRIPGQQGETYKVHNEIPDSPEHTLRFRSYLDLSKTDWYFTVSAIWRSKYSRVEGYDYIAQVAPYTDEGLIIDPPEDELDLSFTVEKRFFDERLSLDFWARDVLTEERFEGFSTYAGSAYPHSVHRTFGGGLSIRF